MNRRHAPILSTAQRNQAIWNTTEIGPRAFLGEVPKAIGTFSMTSGAFTTYRLLCAGCVRAVEAETYQGAAKWRVELIICHLPGAAFLCDDHHFAMSAKGPEFPTESTVRVPPTDNPPEVSEGDPLS